MTDNKNILDQFKTNKGFTIYEMSFVKPIMVVFIRHTGCLFCKETLSDINKNWKKILKNGTEIVIVHHSDSISFQNLIEKYNISKIPYIVDKDRILYKALNLKEVTFKNMINLKTIVGSFRAILNGNFQTKSTGNEKQLGGVFLIFKGEFVKKFIYNTPSDNVNYSEYSVCNS